MSHTKSIFQQKHQNSKSHSGHNFCCLFLQNHWNFCAEFVWEKQRNSSQQQNSECSNYSFVWMVVVERGESKKTNALKFALFKCIHISSSDTGQIKVLAFINTVCRTITYSLHIPDCLCGINKKEKRERTQQMC